MPHFQLLKTKKNAVNCPHGLSRPDSGPLKCLIPQALQWGYEAFLRTWLRTATASSWSSGLHGTGAVLFVFLHPPTRDKLKNYGDVLTHGTQWADSGHIGLHWDTLVLVRPRRPTTFIPGKPARSNTRCEQFCTIHTKLTQTDGTFWKISPCISKSNLCLDGCTRFGQCTIPFLLLILRYIFPTNTVRPLTSSDVVEIIYC